MSLKSFLGRLRKQSPDLPNMGLIGGPTSIQERIQLPLMPDAQTTPRNIELRKSEDNKVFAVVWHVGKQSFNEIFREESQVKLFYDNKMRELHEAAQQEVALIKFRLQEQYDQSWKGAKSVLFYKGFRVHIGFSETEQPVKINPQFLGLIRGECPYCKVVQDFDVREDFQRFLKSLDDVLSSDERLMPSHGGMFSEVGLSVRNPCPECRSYPRVFFKALSNRGLLKQLKTREGGLAEPKGVSNFVSYEQLQNSLKAKKVEKPSRKREPHYFVRFT